MSINSYLFIGDKDGFKPLIKQLKTKIKNSRYQIIGLNELGFNYKGFFDIITRLDNSKEVEQVYRKFNCDITYLTTRPERDYIKYTNNTRTRIYELVESDKYKFEYIYGKTIYSRCGRIEYTNIDEAMKCLVNNELNPSTGKAYAQDLPDWQFNYYNSWLCKIRFRILDRLTNSLNYYGLKIVGRCMLANEFDFLGQGGSNTAILCKTTKEVLRISEVHREFKSDCLQILTETNTGYTPVKQVINEEGIKFIILPLLKPIINVNEELMNNCLNKFIRFMRKHKDFLFTDFWHENFMQSLNENEYYVSDLDMETLNNEPIDNLDEYNKMLKGEKTVKVGYDQLFYKSFCKKFKIEESGFVFSLIAAGLYKLAGFNDFVLYNKDMETKLLQIVKNEKI